MRDKFALVDKLYDEPEMTDGEWFKYTYETIVECGMGPRKLRLTVWIDGWELCDDTLEAYAHGPARWLWQMVGLRDEVRHRGSGETGGMPVTIDETWEILTAAGLPAHYNFA